MGRTAGQQHTRLNTPQESTLAQAYARQLLEMLAATFAVHAPRPSGLAEEHPALAWARSGLMSLTGLPEGEARMCPVPLAACADGALAALSTFAPAARLAGLRGSQLLAERAALAGHQRQGRISPGGSCRLLETADGVVALNLARDDDWALLPAWLETEGVTDWQGLAQCLRERTSVELVGRGRLLGLAVAMSAGRSRESPAWFSVCHTSSRRRQSVTAKPPLVLDLSSLWAGPLCSHLLSGLGAEVIKVESLQRPDGARRGSADFFDLLNAGKRSVALDFSCEQGRAQLRALIGKADIVIEGSRPRALRQLGIHAEACLEENPGLSWIALSGYGRSEARQDWVAYGDDAAVAAGLSQVQYLATGEHMFVGDAIADPLTGLHAALVAWASHACGGGRLISLALSEVTRHCLEFDCPSTAAAIRQRQQRWTQLAEGEVAQPRKRTIVGSAPAQGADTMAVLSGLGIAC